MIIENQVNEAIELFVLLFVDNPVVCAHQYTSFREKLRPPMSQGSHRLLAPVVYYHAIGENSKHAM